MRMEELQTGLWGYQKEGVYKLVASMEESYSVKPPRCRRRRLRLRNWRPNCALRKRNTRRAGKIRI